MKKLNLEGTTLAIFICRWILGLMFLMPGYAKVFGEGGAVGFARETFVNDYQETWIPVWLLWTLGFLVPWVEFLAGGLVCVGLLAKTSVAALGCILVIVVYGQTLMDPFFDMSADVFPLLVLVVFLLAAPREKDLLSVDGIIRSKSQ